MNIPTRTQVKTEVDAFLPSLTEPMHISAIIREVADKMNLSNEARSVKCQYGHGADYTLFGSYVLFSLVDLQKKKQLRLLGANFWQLTATATSAQSIKRKDINAAIISIKQLHYAGITDRDTTIIMLLDKWNESVLSAAYQEFSSNTP